MRVAILLCKVGHEPEAVSADDSLASFRQLVGGNLEAHRLGGRVHMFVNESGFGALEGNRLSPFGLVCGDFFLSAADAQGETVSMTRAELHEWGAAVKGWPQA